MTLTARDKKLLMLIVPVLLAAAYWFLLLTPKREEVATVEEELTQVETRRDTAVAGAAQLDQAKRGFSDDYATVISLGKALPETVDMPSLLVQLDRAARGTGIEFDKIATGTREAAPAAPADEGNQSGGKSDAGGEKAETGNGKAVEAANNTAAGSGGAPSSGAGGGGSGVTGLDSVPLDFEFTGSFFDLADFFHRLKRFVRVANDRVIVRGRLMTIDHFSFTAGDDFPNLKATIQATVYLAPRAQGATAGASPSGPSQTPEAPSGGEKNQTASSPTPTATAIK